MGKMLEDRNIAQRRLCMQKIFSAVGCVRMWKEGMHEWRAEKESQTRGKQKWEKRGGEKRRKGQNQKNECLAIYSRISVIIEWEIDWDFSFFFSECVFAVSSSVIVVFVVLVSLSFVNGFGENILADSD